MRAREIRAENVEVVGLAVDVAEGHLDVAARAKLLAGWANQIELPDE